MKVTLIASVGWRSDIYSDPFYKEVDLPLPPFPGLKLQQLVGTEYLDEWIVKEVMVNLADNEVRVYLRLIDDPHADVVWDHEGLVELAELMEAQWSSF